MGVLIVKKNLKITSMLLIVCFVLTIFTVQVFAGGNKPLTLDTVEPADGDKNVPVDCQIKLTFSKNVVNMKVKDNNIKCFKLVDSEGNNVDVEVIMADDQMEREKRKDIILKPASSLKEDSQYTVIISPDLTAKNGVALGEEVKINFTTEGGASGSLYIWGIVAVVVIIVLILILRRKNPNEK